MGQKEVSAKHSMDGRRTGSQALLVLPSELGKYRAKSLSEGALDCVIFLTRGEYAKRVVSGIMEGVETQPSARALRGGGGGCALLRGP